MERIVYFLILLFFAARFLVYPIVRSIISTVKLIAIKRSVAKLGDKLIEMPAVSKMKSAIIWNGLMIASIVALCIVNGLYAYLIALFVVLPGFLDALLIDAYTKFNGIYKNGIIMGGPMLWEQLFSWKVLDEHHFSILTNDGIRFDMPSANNEDAIKNIFLENGIKEEI